MAHTLERLRETLQLAPQAKMPSAMRPPPRDDRGAPTAVVTAARRLNRAAGVIAASVLIDSAMEHYRGNFHNKAMWTPLVTSSLSIAVSIHGLSDKRHGAHPVRDLVYAIAGLTGLIGTGFHLYNVTKKVGGFNWQNIFYSAPLGAPAAMSLSGLMGFLAERVRDNEPQGEPDVFGLPAGRVVAATTAASLLGTTAEAGLLHFRGAFHNPAMLLPVTMPPVAAVLLGAAAAGDAAKSRKASRGLDGRHRGDGRRRRRVPRLRRVARHGRMAQLAAECVCRPAAARAARVHRSRACRSCRFGAAQGARP